MTMTMKSGLLFSRSSNWFSRLICKVLREPVSHVAIYFGPDYFGEAQVLEATFFGVRSTPYKEWLERQDRVTYLPAQISPEEAEIHLGSLYDYPAFTYLALSFLLRRIFPSFPLPKANLWDSTGMFMCTEYVERVLDLNIEDIALYTPHQLYYHLKQKEI